MNHYDPVDYGHCPYCMGGAGHTSGCPNAEPEEPAEIGVCDICEDSILETDDHYIVNSKCFHEGCFNIAYLVRGK